VQAKKGTFKYTLYRNIVLTKCNSILNIEVKCHLVQKLLSGDTDTRAGPNFSIWTAEMIGNKHMNASIESWHVVVR